MLLSSCIVLSVLALLQTQTIFTIANSRFLDGQHESVAVGLDSEIQYVHMESMMTRDSIQRIVDLKPHPETMHELMFAIKQSNADKMHDLLMERSTPGQPLYQRWMSNDEVRALTANPTASTALLTWFMQHGIVVDWMNRGQEYFRVRTTVSQWERLLRTTFHEYHEETLNEKHVKAIRAESYSLPTTIAIHVEAVFGVVDFPVPLRKFSGSSEVSDFDLWMNQKSPSSSLESESRQAVMHTEAVTGITWVQLNQFADDPSCTREAITVSINYAVGYCIPKSIANGVGSIYLNATGAMVSLSIYSDSFCQAPISPPQQLPTDGACAMYNGKYSRFVLSNGTKSTPAPISPDNQINLVK